MTNTQTPWRVFKNPDGTRLVGIGGLDGEGILDAGFGVWAWSDPEGIANAELVVKAVNSHQALVDALEHVTELLVDTWNREMHSNPEKQMAVYEARGILAVVGGVKEP